MSDQPTFGFGKFVPGFDFLQNLAKGTSQSMPQMPNMSSWVAPTLNVEELDKRIQELKAVHFWLDQNSKALAATVQALELQKMTLATLKGMNFKMEDMARAMKLDVSDVAASRGQKDAVADPEPDTAAKGKTKGAAAAVVDPLQWWGALTQQFQQIAADAMKDAGRSTAVDTARTMASGVAREAMKNATKIMKSTAPGSGAKPARKVAPKRASRKAAGRSAARKTGR